MDLHTLFGEYEALRLAQSQPHTRRKYRYALNRLGRHLGRPAVIADLSDAALVRFRTAMLDEGLSRATANSYVAHLVALWNFAFRQGHTATAPNVRDLPEIQREPVALTPGQVADLLMAASRLRYSIAGIPAAAWWTALFLTLYDTGWRVSAARSLRWADVRETDATLLVRGEYQKTLKDSRRRVAADTLNAIVAIRHPVRTLVFPWDRCRTHFWALSRKIFLAAGLPDDRRYRCHAIRRTHGTLVAAALGDFKGAESLQHANVATFRRHYRDPSMIPALDVLAVLPRPVG